MSILEFLESEFNRTVGFVRFAEAKNASLMAAAFASIFASLSSIEKFAENDVVKILIFVHLVLMFFSLVESVFSFFPKKRKSLKIRRTGKKKEQLGNMVYFGEIMYASIAQYEETLKTQFPKHEIGKKIIEDYIDQIIANSIVASAKMSRFSRALILFLTSIVFQVFGVWALLIVS